MNKKLLVGALIATTFLAASQEAEAGFLRRLRGGSTQEQTRQDATDITPEAGARLRVWESEGPEGEFMALAAEKFEAKYGIPVTFEAVGMTEALTRLAQDGPAGVGADVFVFPHDRLGEGMDAGLIMENLVSANRISTEFMDAAVMATTRDNKVYAWPLSIETYALFYNKDVLPKGPETFEELIEFGKGFTNRRTNNYGIFWEIGNAYFGHAFLAMDGGYVFGNNGTNASDIGINNRGAVRGIENMVKLKPISVANSGDVTYAAMMGLFQEGKVATMINGPWAIGDLRAAGTNFGVVPFPTFGGKNLNSFSGVRLAGVSTYSSYPRAAQMFADFMTSDEMLLERYRLTGQIPPVNSLLGAPEIANNDNVRPFLEQAQNATPMPGIPEMRYFWDPVGAALAEAWDGGATPKRALDTAAQTMREAIGLTR